MKFSEKLKSRKFLAALAGASIGIAVALGADEADINAAIGAVTSIVSLVAYIIAESRIDAAAAAAKQSEKESGGDD